MRTRSVWLLSAAVLFFGSSLLGQDKKPFLTPSEVMKLMEKSKVNYVIASFDQLKPEETRDLTSRLFPAACPTIMYPKVEWKGGRATVREWEFGKEALEILEKAEAAFAAKDYDLARRLYERALKAAPDCYMATANIGDCYLMTGLHEQALAEYEKALLKNPNDHKLYLYRGDALLRLGKVEEAWQDMIHALMLCPRYKYVLQVVNSPRSPFKNRIRESLFNPPVVVRKEGNNIAAYIDAGNHPGDHWLVYACVKAIWAGEPDHRRKMTGDTGSVWSTTEERECLANLMTVYQSEIDDRAIVPEPDLETLRSIIEADDTEPFLLYEVYSRICPWGILTLPEETQKRVEAYIQKYLVTPQP